MDEKKNEKSDKINALNNRALCSMFARLIEYNKCNVDDMFIDSFFYPHGDFVDFLL